MANIKYLVTVDSETGTATKLERVGESGDLEEIDLSKFFLDIGNVGGTPVVANIYGGGAAVSPKGAVKLTDGDDLYICFPSPRPPGRSS
jgi:hypothetical protein